MLVIKTLAEMFQYRYVLYVLLITTMDELKSSIFENSAIHNKATKKLLDTIFFTRKRKSYVFSNSISNVLFPLPLKMF